MTTRVDYTIVVPSSRRSHLMGGLLKLLPTAIVCVDEREEGDYRPHVPDDQLWLHPPLPSLPAIRNWIMDNVATPAHAQIDDDLTGVYSMVHRSRRRISHPAAIRRLIENAVNMLVDLDLTCHCWGRVANGTLYSNCEPFRFAALMSSAFVLYEPTLRFDLRLAFNADLDFTLQLLLHDRILLRDERFVFDHGAIAGGRGGAQALRTADDVARWKQIIKSKWGRYVLLDQKNATQLTRGSKGGATANRIRVRRRARIGNQ